jgi:predicted permease
LVVLAGLFISSLLKILHVDRGFQSEHVLSAQVVLPSKQYGDAATRNAFYERALQSLRMLPGVQSAGTISVLPLNGDNWVDIISKTGDTRPLWQKPDARFRWISSGYFETLHVPLIAGRFLSEEDKGKNVAIVSQHAAQMVWPNQNPIGQHFMRDDPNEAPMEVIGVVGDIRTLDLSQAAPRMVYVPYWIRSRDAGSFVIRTSNDPASMSSAVRKAIWSIDAQIPSPEVRTMDVVVNGSVAARRFQMHLLLTFAISALLLAGLGIYGVVAYTALERTREIGIRTALGAQTGDVYRLILFEGITPVLAGTVLGVGLAFLAGRMTASLLFEVRPYDPLVTGLSCAILIAVGILACLLPAWKATKIDPIRALRYE